MNFLKLLVGFLFMLETKKGIYDCVQLGKAFKLGSSLLHMPKPEEYRLKFRILEGGICQILTNVMFYSASVTQKLGLFH